MLNGIVRAPHRLALIWRSVSEETIRKWVKVTGFWLAGEGFGRSARCWLAAKKVHTERLWRGSTRWKKSTSTPDHENTPRPRSLWRCRARAGYKLARLPLAVLQRNTLRAKRKVSGSNFGSFKILIFKIWDFRSWWKLFVTVWTRPVRKKRDDEVHYRNWRVSLASLSHSFNYQVHGFNVSFYPLTWKMADVSRLNSVTVEQGHAAAMLWLHCVLQFTAGAGLVLPNWCFRVLVFCNGDCLSQIHRCYHFWPRVYQLPATNLFKVTSGPVGLLL